MFLGYQNGKIKFYTENKLDTTFYNIDKVEETQDEYVLDGDEYVLKDEVWEEKQRQKEKERIGKLTCTKRVFALMLQELGVDYLTVLLPLIESNPQAKLEWDLCVELERKNPLLDIMAGQLGITPEQLDGLFKYANGEITLEDFKGLYVITNNDLQIEE
jgi:hypothetical protein